MYVINDSSLTSAGLQCELCLQVGMVTGQNAAEKKKEVSSQMV